MLLLDTNILIDITRNNSAAIGYIDSLNAPLSLSVVSVTELLAGVRYDKEHDMLERIFSQVELYDITSEVADLAGRFLQHYRKSHGLGIIDALIGASAMVNEAVLVTRNVKHFPMFPALKAPY